MAVGAAAVGLAAAAPAQAATLTQVTNFGSNPGNDTMHLYVPNNVQSRPPILVALHPCGGNGPGFYQSSEFASLADRYGFIVIYPTSTDKIGCFDNYSDASKRRGGGTDAESIVSMVNWTLQRYDGDAGRVYATGASSGGMMTNALLALYPDVFKAGAAFMGVPFGCFPYESDYLAGTSICASGNNSKSAQEWGNLVRSAYPGYSGPYPRMQLWHGTRDSVVNYRNLQMEIDQWTNVHGLSNRPTSTDYPQSGWTRTRYADSSGQVKVEAISVANADHSLPERGMAAMAISFFGLDGTVTPDPTPTPTPTPDPTPDPTPTTGGGSCEVTYKANSWNSGLVADITIKNTSSQTVNGWTLTVPLASGQTLASGWNATYSTSSGNLVAKNVGYNGTIPPGGSISLGYQLNHNGNSGAPASFSLNGSTCTTT